MQRWLAVYTEGQVHDWGAQARSHLQASQDIAERTLKEDGETPCTSHCIAGISQAEPGTEQPIGILDSSAALAAEKILKIDFT
jgi:hypothetical protein